MKHVKLVLDQMKQNAHLVTRHCFSKIMHVFLIALQDISKMMVYVMVYIDFVLLNFSKYFYFSYRYSFIFNYKS